MISLANYWGQYSTFFLIIGIVVFCCPIADNINVTLCGLNECELQHLNPRQKHGSAKERDLDTAPEVEQHPFLWKLLSHAWNQNTRWVQKYLDLMCCWADRAFALQPWRLIYCFAPVLLVRNDLIAALLNFPNIFRLKWMSWTKSWQWNESLHGCCDVKRNIYTVLQPLLKQCKLVGKEVFLGPSASCEDVITGFGHYAKTGFKAWRSSWGPGHK